MKTKSLLGKLILICCLLYASILGIFLSKNSIVINYGIAKFRIFLIFSIVISIMFTILILVIFILSKSKKKSVVEYTIDNSVVEKAKSLIVELTTVSRTKWKKDVELINKIVMDLNNVLSYYQSMEKEVENLDNPELSDADDILSRVIQSMSYNINQLLRFMRVMNNNDENTIKIEINKCYEQNSNLSRTAQDFVKSILNYVNNDKDGDNAKAISYINSFKNIVLGELDLTDKYI